MKRSEHTSDPVKREEGAWVKDIPGMGDLILKVRGVNNRDWRRMQGKLVNAVPRSKRVDGVLDPDEQDRINVILLRECCLLDWRNFEDDDGVVAYTKERAGKELGDPEFTDFREAVMWAALEVAKAGQFEIEGDAKN